MPPLEPPAGSATLRGLRQCWTLSCWPSRPDFSSFPSATPTPATGSEESAMTIDYWLGAAVTAGLLIYLTYALLRPERF